MTTVLTATGIGASGTMYKFEMYPLGTPFADNVPGIYVFCKVDPPSNWTALYVGQTHDLNARVGAGLGGHHKIDLALAHGATHVGVFSVNGREADRLRIEADICQAMSPICNDLPRAGSGRR